MKIKNKLKEIQKSWYFLVAMILIYSVVSFFNYNLFESSLKFFLSILTKIIPVFIFMFFLMVLTNYFITTNFILKYIEKGKGIDKWIFAVVGGILSTGPIYMWYPFLADLKAKGISDGLLACFLYNRGALKIPLLPLTILYFGWKYVIVLSLVMVFVSVIQGIIINKMKIKN